MAEYSSATDRRRGACASPQSIKRIRSPGVGVIGQVLGRPAPLSVRVIVHQLTVGVFPENVRDAVRPNVGREAVDNMEGPTVTVVVQYQSGDVFRARGNCDSRKLGSRCGQRHLGILS